jgi:hypothetical protein
MPRTAEVPFACPMFMISFVLLFAVLRVFVFGRVFTISIEHPQITFLNYL